MVGNNVANSFRRLKVQAIGGWLRCGWTSFLRTKGISIAFSSLFAVVGMLGMYVLIVQGWSPMVYPLAGGFMLVVPVLLTGFFAVAVSLRQGQSVHFLDLFAGFRRAPLGLWLISAVASFLFLVWITDAAVLYAVYFGTTPILLSLESLTELIRNQYLVPFFMTSTLIGAGLAFIIYSITAFSVPLMFHERWNFTQAVFASVRAVFGNLPIMLTWGLILSTGIFVTILILFPLFVITFPVLAYASDQAYREVWLFEEESGNESRELASRITTDGEAQQVSRPYGVGHTGLPLKVRSSIRK